MYRDKMESECRRNHVPQFDGLSVAVGFAGGALIGGGLGFKLGYEAGYQKASDECESEYLKKSEDLIDLFQKLLDEDGNKKEKKKSSEKKDSRKNDRIEEIFSRARE
jgi:hypothetical protein